MKRRPIAVIGLGRFGSSVGRTLESLGHEVLGIDSDQTKADLMSGELTHTAACDCTDEDALRTLGLRNFETVIVAIGHDVQASILATVLLKEMGIPSVVVKASSQLHGRTLTKVGADKVVYPERDMGARIAHSLVTGSDIDYLELSPEFSIVEFTAPKSMQGLSVRELDLRALYGVNIIALKSDDEINAAPHATDIIRTGDVLVLLGTNTGIHQLERKLQET